MRTFILSDIHIGCRNSKSVFFEQVKRVFEGIKKDIREGDEVLILGDIFDNRNYITIQALDCAKYCFDLLKDYKITAFLGNHDIHLTNKLRPNSVEPFLGLYPNIKIVMEPTEIKLNGEHRSLLVPWIVPSAEYVWKKLIRESSAEYCFGHFDIIGCSFNKYTKNMDHGLEQSDFFTFKEVYSGHYHYASEMSNITYLGSQYQMTWDDLGEKKYVHILEQDMSMTKVSYCDEIFLEISDQDELPEIPLGSFVRYIMSVDDNIEANRMKSEIMKRGASEVKVILPKANTIKLKTEQLNEELKRGADVADFVVESVDNAETEGVDKTELKICLKDILTKAREDVA